MMTLSEDQRNLIEDIIDDENDVDISKNYSGRYMYGDECFGIVMGQYFNPSAFLAKFVLMLQDEGERDLAYELAGSVREDNMGLGSIVYFPSIKWGKSEIGIS